MDYSKLITVNYNGGAGGEFFCYLLDSSLNNKPFNASGDSNNKFRYSSEQREVDGLNLYRSPFTLYSLHSDADYRELFEQAYDSVNNTIGNDEMYTSMYNLYLHVKDDDDDVIKQNIVDIYRQFIVPPETYKINFFFNIKPYTPGLTLSDIYPNSKNILLTASQIKYIKIFWFLGWYKNKPNYSADINKIQMKYANVPSDPTPLNEKKFYMDKVMFDNNFEDYVEEINSELSLMLGTNIQLDIEAIRTYRSTNQAIIRNFFSLDESDDILSDEVVELIDSFMNTSAYPVSGV